MSLSLFRRARECSLADERSVPLGLTRAEGFIKNVNTIEEFKNIDKAALIQSAGEQVGVASSV